MRADENSEVVGETEQERKDRLQQRQKNRNSFDNYLLRNMADRIDQALYLSADVVDTRPFNPHTFRPLITRLQTIAALVAMGVEETAACDMVAEVSNFPVSCETVKKEVCLLSCTVCGQHELKEGTRIMGFLPRHETIGLTMAPWSEWQPARARYGVRGNQGRCYLRNLCQRCELIRRPTQDKSNAKKKHTRALVKRNLEYHDPQKSDASAEPTVVDAEQQRLINHCEVHRTATEKLLWTKFHKLSAELDILGVTREARQHKVRTLREIAGAMNMTSSECALQYKQWPRRQRMCDRRKLDRVLQKSPRKRLSAWIKLLQGQWMTKNGSVTLSTVQRKGHKVLQWRSVRNGKLVTRLLRVRSKTDKKGMSHKQYVLAGGSDERVQLWLVNTTKSTDNDVVWRAYTSSFTKLTPVQEIVYHRMQAIVAYSHTSTLTLTLALTQVVRPRTRQTARTQVGKVPVKRRRTPIVLHEPPVKVRTIVSPAPMPSPMPMCVHVFMYVCVRVYIRVILC